VNEEESLRPAIVVAQAAPLRVQASNYPEPFASRVSQREKRPLGDLFGLRNFGVNLTTVLPGGLSALRHAHSRQDEFVYVLDGELVLVADDGEHLLCAGMCAGFAAGTGRTHQLVNRSTRPATYLEVGDRSEGDAVSYPHDDLVAERDGARWHFRHKDGTPYPR
jgi:uncharacterized cupin superfamily protein